MTKKEICVKTIITITFICLLFYIFSNIKVYSKNNTTKKQICYVVDDKCITKVSISDMESLNYCLVVHENGDASIRQTLSVSKKSYNKVTIGEEILCDVYFNNGNIDNIFLSKKQTLC